MKKSSVMTYVAIACVVMVVVVFVTLVYESRALSYLSSDPKVCITCHTMNTHYATWQHSSHREQARCVDCHLPRDSFVQKMIAKSIDGYNHSVAMTFGTYGKNLRVTSSAAERIQSNCISCHQGAVSQMHQNSEHYASFDDDVSMGRRCWDCHRMIPHGRTKSLLSTPDTLGVKEFKNL
jgi:cytochrome c nitrite reductase small subunit